MFRRLKLLNYLRQIHLSPEDTLALIRRLETDSCRPEDCEVLIRIVQAHTELSADFLHPPPVDEPPSLARQVKRPRQGAKRTRRRADREWHEGVDTACAVRYHLFSKRPGHH